MEESEKCSDNSSGKNHWVQERSTSQKALNNPGNDRENGSKKEIQTSM
jgi:hypothetical protein